MSDRGAVTIWLLGFTIAVLFLGGIAVDLFRGFGRRQELAGMADSAAVAGATALDIPLFRSGGLVRLDPVLAEARAWDHLGAEAGFDDEITAFVAATEDEIVVELETTVEFTLMRLLYHGEPLLVHVGARSLPVELVP